MSATTPRFPNAPHNYDMQNESQFRASLHRALVDLASPGDVATNLADLADTFLPSPANTNLLQFTGSGDWRAYAFDLNDWISGTANYVLQSTGTAWTARAVLTLEAGSAGAPAYSYTGATTSGMYRSGTDQVGITAGGTPSMLFGTASVLPQLPILLTDGSAAAPSLAFNSGATDGLYWRGAGDYGFAVSGNLHSWKTAQVQSYTVAGDGASDSFAFNIYTNTANTNRWHITARGEAWTNASERRTLRYFFYDGAVFRFIMALSYEGGNTQIRAATGTGANPAYTFNSYPTTGLYAAAGPQLRLAVGGTSRIVVLDSSSYIGFENSTSDEQLRLIHASTTGSPYISWYQTVTRRSYLQFADSNDTFRMVNEYGPVWFYTGSAGTPTLRMVINGSTSYVHIQGSSASEQLRIAHSSATGSPFISFFQTTTRRSYIRHLDSSDAFTMVSEYGLLQLQTGYSGTSQVQLELESFSANHGTIEWKNGGVVWEGIDNGTGSKVLDSREGNMFTWDWTGSVTLTLAQTPINGYVANLFFNYSSGAGTFTASGFTVRWNGGTAPDTPASGETLWVQLLWQDSVCVGDWGMYST